MLERSLLLGVDAGSAKAAAVLADLTGGEPQVIGVGVAQGGGVRRGLVVDLAATREAVQQAVNKAREMADQPDVVRAVISISGPHIQSLVGTAELPVSRPSAGVSSEDIRRVLEQAAAVELPVGREVVHVVPRAFRLDGAEGILDPLGLSGRELEAEAHLITAERLPLQNHFRAAEQAGLEIVDYQLAIRAAGAAVLTPEEREVGVLLLDIGAETTGVAVYDSGYLWYVSVLPVGGAHITSDIASLLRTPVGMAERLKLERGWASPDLCPDTHFEVPTPSGLNTREVADKQLAAIIQSRVEEILQLAAQQVKRSGYPGLFPAGVVITGGGARLQGLLEAAADSLSLPARLGVPADPLVAEPELATAAGLVQFGARLVADEAAVAEAREQSDTWHRLRSWFQRLFG